MNNIKYIESLIIGIILALINFPQAHAEENVPSGTCGTNCEWKIVDTIDGGKELQITGSGRMNDYYWTSDRLSPWYSYRNDITSASVSNNITHIGGAVFYNLKNLSSVDIPNSVTTMGEYVFSDTPNLKHIDFPQNLTAIPYMGMQRNGSESLILPPSVTSIGSVAFNGASTKTIYCTSKQLASGGACDSSKFSNMYYAGTTAHYEIEDGHYVLYSGDDIVGIYSNSSNLLSDTVVDSYVKKNANRNITEKYDGRGNLIATYDSGGNLIRAYENGIATYRRKIYTVPEAIAAVQKGAKNTFSIIYR